MKYSTQQSGFTMFEVVVMLAIIAAISSVVLISFGGLNEGAALNRSAREVGLSLRKAQNMSLAVTGIRTSTGSVVLPKAVGVRFDLANPGYYEIFADVNLDGKWSSLTDILIAGANDLKFARNAKILGLEHCQPDPPGTCPGVVHVIFVAPEASVILTDQDGNDIGDRADIRLGQPNGVYTRTVSIRTSGQVSIK